MPNPLRPDATDRPCEVLFEGCVPNDTPRRSTQDHPDNRRWRALRSVVIPAIFGYPTAWAAHVSASRRRDVDHSVGAPADHRRLDAGAAGAAAVVYTSSSISGTSTTVMRVPGCETWRVSVDPATEIESAVRAALPAAAAPWKVTADRLDDDTWVVELTHEASNGLVFETGKINASDAAAIVVAWVDDSREVQRVARAPKLTHAATIAGVRTLVQMFGWSRTEVRAVVGLLTELQALSADEAEWFRSSFGQDRPPPRASAIV